MGFKNPTGSWSIITFNLRYISLPNHSSMPIVSREVGGGGIPEKRPGNKFACELPSPEHALLRLLTASSRPSHTLKITSRILVPLPLPCCWSLWCCFRLWRTQRHYHSECLSWRCDLIAESTPVPQFNRIQLRWRQTQTTQAHLCARTHTYTHTHTHTHTHTRRLPRSSVGVKDK